VTSRTHPKRTKRFSQIPTIKINHDPDSRRSHLQTEVQESRPVVINFALKMGLESQVFLLLEARTYEGVFFSFLFFFKEGLNQRQNSDVKDQTTLIFIQKDFFLTLKFIISNKYITDLDL